VSFIQHNVTRRRPHGKRAPEGAPAPKEEIGEDAEKRAEEAARPKNKNAKEPRRHLLASAARVSGSASAIEGKRGACDSSGATGNVVDHRPHRPPVAGTTHISGPALCARYGVVGMTLHRWERSEKLGFPKPRWINNRKYWVLAEIEGWER
jgi:hypothetical protein